MGTRLVFDIETDSIDATVVHCIVAQDLDSGAVHSFSESFRKGDLADGLMFLGSAEELWGHNIIGFDLPVLERLHGFVPTSRIYCTLLGSRSAYAGKELHQRDALIVRRGDMPVKLMGSHSLAAWGHRIGPLKSEFTAFETFTPEMLAYCKNDVVLNVNLVERLLRKVSREVIELEGKVDRVLRRQTAHGVGFDVRAAVALSGQLAKRREELGLELRAMFQPWYAPKGKVVSPKRSVESKKYAPGDSNYRNVAAGCEYQNIELVEFNPASGEHIARVLQQYRGWKPQEFTDGGLVKTEEKILSDLPWPECKALVEYQRLKKLLGYISEGQGAWLKLECNGRIHGRMHPTGTVLARMSHMSPNLGQVPKVGKPFGRECRALFVAGKGKVLVGVDASGLQLRLMAHYLHRYDGGAFAKVIEEGQDVHTYMQQGTGVLRRDNAKTLHYAWLFGAGNYKLGSIVIFDLNNALELGEWTGEVPALEEAGTLGTRARRGLERRLKMGVLVEKLEESAKRGYLKSLDGRQIPVLSKHRALNALLMAGEAVLMKHALVIAAPGVYAMGGEFVLNVHDEWQVECDPSAATAIGEHMAQCIRLAGERLGLRCKLDAKYKIGTDWSETH